MHQAPEAPDDHDGVCKMCLPMSKSKSKSFLHRLLQRDSWSEGKDNNKNNKEKQELPGNPPPSWNHHHHRHHRHQQQQQPPQQQPPQQQQHQQQQPRASAHHHRHRRSLSKTLQDVIKIQAPQEYFQSQQRLSGRLSRLPSVRGISRTPSVHNHPRVSRPPSMVRIPRPTSLRISSSRPPSWHRISRPPSIVVRYSDTETATAVINRSDVAMIDHTRREQSESPPMPLLRGTRSNGSWDGRRRSN